MGDTDNDVDKWDRGATKRVIAVTRPIVKLYFRSEVRGLDNLPAGACLLVANHSGGLTSFDLSVFAVGYYDRFGYDRPLYALGFDTLFGGPAADFFRRTGVIRATRENAAKALAGGAVVLVFPGGDLDVYRPTARENVIDFGGRTGYLTPPGNELRGFLVPAGCLDRRSCGYRRGLVGSGGSRRAAWSQHSFGFPPRFDARHRPPRGRMPAAWPLAC